MLTVGMNVVCCGDSVLHACCVICMHKNHQHEPTNRPEHQTPVIMTDPSLHQIRQYFSIPPQSPPQPTKRPIQINQSQPKRSCIYECTLVTVPADHMQKAVCTPCFIDDTSACTSDPHSQASRHASASDSEQTKAVPGIAGTPPGDWMQHMDSWKV